MMIPEPTEIRKEIIDKVYEGLVDPSELTDWEMAWLENTAMKSIISSLAETNPLVFSEVEEGMIN